MQEVLAGIRNSRETLSENVQLLGLHFERTNWEIFREITSSAYRKAAVAAGSFLAVEGVAVTVYDIAFQHDYKDALAKALLAGGTAVITWASVKGMGFVNGQYGRAMEQLDGLQDQLDAKIRSRYTSSTQ